MANYITMARTNYFRVTDEDRYQELLAMLTSEDTIHDFTYTDKNNIRWHGFGCYGSVIYAPDDEDEDENVKFDDWLHELQKILPDDDAFILFGNGYEKLRCVDGWVTVVTSKEIHDMTLDYWAKDMARQLLGPEFKTQTYD